MEAEIAQVNGKQEPRMGDAIVLTEAQSLVLDAMRGHIKQHGAPATLDYLCRATGTSSVGSMHKHVAALIQNGWVTKDEHGKPIPATHCPCCGKSF